MRICYKCKKREGAWWDHICKHCRNRPQSEKEALEYDYDKENSSKDILTPEEIAAPKDVRKYNKSAIFGIVLSAISIFGIGLAGIAGFILGIVALVQIKHTGEKGKTVAIIAIIAGLIWSFGVGILKRLLEAGY